MDLLELIMDNGTKYLILFGPEKYDIGYDFA